MARGTTVSCKLAGNADGLDRLAEYFGGVGALLVSSTLSVTLRLGRQDESAEAGGGGMRVLQIPAMPLDRMWGHGPVPPLEGALELLHEQAARQHAQRNPGVCTAHTHGHPTTPGALIMWGPRDAPSLRG